LTLLTPTTRLKAVGIRANVFQLPHCRPFGKVAEQLGDALAARRPDKRMPIRVDLVEMG